MNVAITRIGIDFGSDIKHGELFARLDYTMSAAFVSSTGLQIKGVLVKNLILLFGI